MKTLFSILVGIVFVSSALGQGSVNFSNTGFSDGIDRLVYWCDGSKHVKLVGTNYAAALYYGTSAGSINSFAVRSLTVTADQTLDRSVGLFRNVTPDSSLAGTWVGGTRYFLDAPVGAQLTLQIRIWDITKFATYAAAVAGGGNIGQSDAFAYTVPAPTDAPGLKLNNLRGFGPLECIPEPSAYVLSALGISLMVMFRRTRRH